MNKNTPSFEPLTCSWGLPCVGYYPRIFVWNDQGLIYKARALILGKKFTFFQLMCFTYEIIFLNGVLKIFRRKRFLQICGRINLEMFQFVSILTFEILFKTRILNNYRNFDGKSLFGYTWFDQSTVVHGNVFSFICYSNMFFTISFFLQ